MPQDEHGHGTHVAGTVAAVRGNGIGMAGVALGAKILCLKGFAQSGVGFSDDLAEAVLYAVTGATAMRLDSMSLVFGLGLGHRRRFLARRPAHQDQSST